MASGASAAPTASAPAAIPVVEPHLVEASLAPDGRTWVPKFSIRRDDGDQKPPLLIAHAACADKGLSLCTEAQWTRACGEDASVGAIETWAVSASGEGGFVVRRRGDKGCSARQVVAASTASPSHAGVCCERAVAIVTENRNRGFLIAVSDKMGKYEQPFGRRARAALAPYLDDEVTFFRQTYDRATLVRKYDAWFTSNPDHWLIHGSCDVAIHGEGDVATWTADCATVVHNKGELAYVTQRYTWSGAGKVQRIEETRVHRKFGPP